MESPKFILFYVDEANHNYCTSCAVKEIIKGVNINITGRDVSYSECDCRSFPECYICGKYMNDVIEL